MQYKRKIFGYECDLYGHLNNANYLHLYEEARAEALDDMKMSVARLSKENLHIYLSEITLTFKIGIPVGENVRIETNMIKATRATSVWKQKIYNSADQLCSTATVRGAFIKDGKPFRISRELFEEYKTYIVSE